MIDVDTMHACLHGCVRQTEVRDGEEPTSQNQQMNRVRRGVQERPAFMFHRDFGQPESAISSMCRESCRKQAEAIFARVSGIGRLVAVGHSQSVGRIARESAADVFPTVAVDADVLESDQRVGEDLKPATTSAFAEGEVLAEIEVAAAGRDYDRKEERGCGWGAPPGARGKLLLALDPRKTWRRTSRKPPAAKRISMSPPPSPRVTDF